MTGAIRAAATGILALGLIGGWSMRAHSQGAAETEAPTSTTDRDLGLGLETLSPYVANSLGLEPDTKGAIVTEVLEATPAAWAGLQTGDVIIEIDQKPVTTADQAASKLSDRKAHLVRVKNARGSRLLTLPGS